MPVDGRAPRPPLPLMDGLSASTLHLPAGSWETILDCLAAHFPAVHRDEWHSRFARGRILDADGCVLAARSPFAQGLRIHYYREVAAETPVPFVEQIVHVDEHLVVADKPHFLPVAPVGRYVQETLLTRLMNRLGNRDLVPLHRIDKGTAGLVLFSANRASRDAYQSLFRGRRIEKRYLAIAPPLPDIVFPHTRSSRIVRGEPFLISREIAGEANAITRIEVAARGSDSWRYDLQPLTGKKHQLRLHLNALGAPILGDDLYPVVCPRGGDDFSLSLKLLARQLRFTDPLSGASREFNSGFTL